MEIIKAILSESKFWTVLFMLIQGILFYFVPSFPKEIWALIDLMYATIITIVLGKQIKSNRAEVKRTQEMLADGEGD